jgi:hypothetical protein
MNENQQKSDVDGRIVGVTGGGSQCFWRQKKPDNENRLLGNER